MFKTFDDFVRKTSRLYGLPFDIAKKYILNQLKSKKLSTKAVIAYINWADGDCLSQKEIGRKLNISQQAVDKHLCRLKSIWPHLFNFGPKIPRFDKRRSDRKKSGGTMGRLRHDVSTKVQKF